MHRPKTQAIGSCSIISMGETQGLLMRIPLKDLQILKNQERFIRETLLLKNIPDFLLQHLWLYFDLRSFLAWLEPVFLCELGEWTLALEIRDSRPAVIHLLTRLRGAPCPRRHYRRGIAVGD